MEGSWKSALLNGYHPQIFEIKWRQNRALGSTIVYMGCGVDSIPQKLTFIVLSKKGSR